MSTAHKGTLLPIRRRPIILEWDDAYWSFDHGLWGTHRGEIIEPLPGYVATLRPGEGKFGGAVAVEEGTTNLVQTSDGAGGEIPVGGVWYDFVADAVDYVEVDTPHGRRTVAHVRWYVDPARDPNYEGGGIQYGYASHGGQRFTVAPSTTYTYSYYLKVRDRDYLHANAIYIRQYDASGVQLREYGVASKTLRIYLGNGWYWIWGTFTTEAAAATAVVQHYAYDTAGNEVWFYNGQLEQKAFPTSFVDGARANGVLQYPDLPAGGDHYTIALWARASTNDPSTWQVLFDGRQSCSRSMLAFSTSDVLTAYYHNASGTNTSYSTGFSMADRTGWHHYALTFSGPRSGGTCCVYVDGQLIHTHQTSLRTPGTGGMYVGRGIPTSELWNGLIDELIILPYAASPDEVRAWYEADAPFYHPYDHSVVAV